MKIFKYISSENRYILEEQDEGGSESSPSTPEYHRVFEQAGVLHTSGETPIRLTRAYNMEDDLAVNDIQLKKGASERGQSVGDISSGHHLKDNDPEIGL